MKATTDHTQKAWRARVKAGPYRPMVRATIERSVMRQYAYNTDDAPGGDFDHERNRRGTFTSLVLGGSHDVVELPNIKTVTWSRSVDQDVAECTIVLLNSTVDPLGSSAQGPDFDNPGAFSEREPGSGTLWPHIDNSWRGRIQPDRLIRTYEGYGVDWDQWPGDDPNLYPSGAWLIDDVTTDPNGEMTIKCRDVGRVLLDQIAFPPAVPRAEYPIEWSTIRTESVAGRAPTGGSWNVPSGGRASSSNEIYIGEGLIDTPPYVGPGGSVDGHKPQHVLMNPGDAGYYWRSTGQTSPDDKVWWEVEFAHPRDLAAIRVRTLGGPYKIWVSVYNGSRWIGHKTIPYDVTTGGVNINADIPFVGAFTPSRRADYDYVFKRKYNNVTKIRLTFTDLRADRAGTDHANYPWSAALDKFGVYQGNYADLGFDTSGTISRPVGNISDWSDMVTWVLAWGGFFWPKGDNANFIRTSPYGTPQHFTYSQDMYALPWGRVWGSIQTSNTAPVADITADALDKQPLMESINQARDVLGFLGFVDESGGYIWRMPNIYKFGNYGPYNLPGRQGFIRTNQIITLDDRTTLLSYEARTSSANLRERVGVTDAQGKYGTVIQGYRPPNYNTNLRRVALWSDGHFASNQETRVAADLIAARQMLDYRKGKATIWGNPAIQIDDQVRIRERVTGETYYHYVSSIECSIDMEAGTFFYDMETCWLGQAPQNGEWVVDTTKLQGVTQTYLNALGGEA